MKRIKGVVLAGGEGTRMRALTAGRNKHLLPVGGEPMAAWPVRRLAEAGVKDVLVVSSASGVGELAPALGDGAEFGCRLTYKVQSAPRGIADALRVAREFADGDPVAVALGDNVFDASLRSHLAQYRGSGAMVFVRRVPDPERYGVATLRGRRVVAIEEKPKKPKSPLAVIGLYVYDGRFASHIDRLKPSARGELEITDLNRAYMRAGKLAVRELRGNWIDAGTPEAYRAAKQLFNGKRGR